VKFSTVVSKLRGVLQVAERASSNTNMSGVALVAYTGVLIQATKNRLVVLGSDSATTIAASIDVDTDRTGSVLVPPKPLLSFLAAANPDAAVELVYEEGNDLLVTVAGLAPYSFRPLATTFPVKIPSRKGATQVDFSRFDQALTAVKPGASGGGIQLVSTGTSLALHATDTFRLHSATLPEAGFGDFTGVFTPEVLAVVAQHPITHVAADVSTRTLRFIGESIIISTRLLATPYPNVETILTAEFPLKVDIPVTQTREALGRLASIAAERAVVLNVEGNRLSVSATSPDHGSGSEHIELSQPYNDLMVALAPKRLNEALVAHQSDTVTLGYVGQLQPVAFSSNNRFPILTVVSPVQTTT